MLLCIIMFVLDSCKSNAVIIYYTKYFTSLNKICKFRGHHLQSRLPTNVIINITWHYVYSKLEKFTVSTDIGTREKISTETMWQPF